MSVPQPSAADLLSGAGAGSKSPAPASASSDGLEDADQPEVFVESTWRGRAVKYEREQQSEPTTTRDVASQAKVTKGMAVSEAMVAGSAGGGCCAPAAHSAVCVCSLQCQTESGSQGEIPADTPLPPGFASFLSAVYPARPVVCTSADLLCVHVVCRAVLYSAVLYCAVRGCSSLLQAWLALTCPTAWTLPPRPSGR